MKMNRDFRIGDIVNVGSTNGNRGKVVDILRPLGTYEMYKVMCFTDGKIVEAAKHELVKGLPDSNFEFFTATGAFDQSYEFEGIFDDEFWDSFEVPDNDDTIKTAEMPHPHPVPDTDSVKPQLLPNMSDTTDSAPPKRKEISQNNSNVKKSKSTKSKATNRFVPMNDDDINDFVAEAENVSTMRKTLAHINLLIEYLKQKGVCTPIIDIPAVELDKHIAAFFITVRQKNGSEYEPVTLRSMMSSFERYLRRHRYGNSIITDIVFDGTRNALKSKQKKLKQAGYGNNPRTADTLEDHEIEYLFEKNQLGTSTPQSMINTLWLNNTPHFGMRAGAEEHRNLKWGDVTLHYDHKLKLEYVLLDKERQTKTRTGEDVRVRRKGGKPAMFAEPGKPPEQCPVHIYKEYADRRPISALQPDSPFYLACNTIRSRPLRATERWFINGAIGANKISGIMKTMVANSELPSLVNKRLTNTSVRKHVCQTLLNNNIPDSVAIHVTGHKNPGTLNNYRQLNNEQKYQMSHMLANSKSTEKSVAKTHESAEKAQSQIEVQSSNIMEANINEKIHALFAGSTINGGTFNIAINIPK